MAVDEEVYGTGPAGYVSDAAIGRNGSHSAWIATMLTMHKAGYR